MAKQTIQKNITLALEIAKRLAQESDVLGGKMGATITEAALMMFFESSPQDKATYINRAQAHTVFSSYDIAAKEIVDVAVKARRDAEKAPVPKRKKKRSGA